MDKTRPSCDEHARPFINRHVLVGDFMFSRPEMTKRVATHAQAMAQVSKIGGDTAKHGDDGRN